MLEGLSNPLSLPLSYPHYLVILVEVLCTALPFSRGGAVFQPQVLAVWSAVGGGAVLRWDRGGAAALLRTRHRRLARGDVRSQGRRVRAQGSQWARERVKSN